VAEHYRVPFNKTAIVSFNALKKAVTDLIPPEAEELSFNAIETGVSFA
jgi:hypothetical protein